MGGRRVVRGLAVSPLAVLGRVRVFDQAEPAYSSEPLPPGHEEEEMRRFREGRERARAGLRLVYEKARAELGEAEAEIFAGHLEILQDPSLEEEVSSAIRGRKLCAEAAAADFAARTAAEFELIEDEYLAARAADIRDIGKRLVSAIAGGAADPAEALPENCIVFARDLTPSDTALLDRRRVVGFVTESGGLGSHVAIMARALDLPALVGAAGALDSIEDGEEAVLDGTGGIAVLGPDEECREACLAAMERQAEDRERLGALKGKQALTRDGRRVELCANVGNLAEVQEALAAGADGIGLFRTEFLFLDRLSLPGEEEQFQAYASAARAFGKKGVVLRTMDIGGDKKIPSVSMPAEQNPFLGWRAIRIGLERPDLLKPQLRAALRAGALGKVRLMFPMIISTDELKRLKVHFEDAKRELAAEGTAFDAELELGIMVETPAAALTAEELAAEADFFSIGTNDLTQYTLAVDRGNEKVAGLYSPYHPAVLRLVKLVVDAAHGAGKRAGMCGELAGDERAAPLLLGLGLDEFSMGPSRLGRVKETLSRCGQAEARRLAERLLSLPDAAGVERGAEAFHRELMART